MMNALIYNINFLIIQRLQIIRLLITPSLGILPLH